MIADVTPNFSTVLKPRYLCVGKCPFRVTHETTSQSRLYIGLTQQYLYVTHTKYPFTTFCSIRIRSGYRPDSLISRLPILRGLFFTKSILAAKLTTAMQYMADFLFYTTVVTNIVLCLQYTIVTKVSWHF